MAETPASTTTATTSEAASAASSSQQQQVLPLPRVAIQFCTQCKWMLRAAYFAQELLSTFSTSLGEVALIPATGGVFTVTITATATATEEAETPQATPSAPRGPQQTTNTLLWDRKTEGGFPETKELKRRVRDVIQPDRDLGHVDRNHREEKEKEKGKAKPDTAAPSSPTATAAAAATAAMSSQPTAANPNDAAPAPVTARSTTGSGPAPPGTLAAELGLKKHPPPGPDKMLHTRSQKQQGQHDEGEQARSHGLDDSAKASIASARANKGQQSGGLGVGGVEGDTLKTQLGSTMTGSDTVIAAGGDGGNSERAKPQGCEDCQ